MGGPLFDHSGPLILLLTRRNNWELPPLSEASVAPVTPWRQAVGHIGKALRPGNVFPCHNLLDGQPAKR